MNLEKNKKETKLKIITQSQSIQPQKRGSASTNDKELNNTPKMNQIPMEMGIFTCQRYWKMGRR